jgi:cysteine desulfurase
MCLDNDSAPAILKTNRFFTWPGGIWTVGRFVYLDYAATTPVDPQVWKAMEQVAIEQFGNPSSLHLYGEQAEELAHQAKRKLLSLFGAQQGKIVLTSGGTESNNLALKGIARVYAHQGKHIIVSAIEHDAILATCHALEQEGFQISYLPVDRYGQIDLDVLASLINEQTILVSVMHANNETGTIQPVAAIGQLLQKKRVEQGTKTPFYHCDAVQTAGQLELQADQWGVDLLSVSAHKFYGPKGVGALYVKKGIRLVPLLDGGGQEYGWRSGTQNVPGLVGMAAALELSRQRLSQDREHYIALNAIIRSSLDSLRGVTCTVPVELALPSHIHFLCAPIEGQAIMQELSRQGIAVSTSSACHAKHWQPSHVMRAMGYDEEHAKQAVRVSLGRLVTEDDIHYFLHHLNKIMESFRSIKAL